MPSAPGPGKGQNPASKWGGGAGGDGKVEAAKLAKDAVGDVRRGLRDAEGMRDRGKAGLDAVEKGLRAAAAVKTAGASEKVLKTKPGQALVKVLRVVVAANLLLPLAMLLALAVLSVVVIAAFTEQAGLEGDLEYRLRDGHPMAIDDPYLRAYQNAAAAHDVPWTVLAGIGKVASDHGRAATGDIAQYGAVVDRAPGRGALTVAGGGSSTAGKSAPPPGSEIVVVGDSLVEGGKGPLAELLTGYTVSYDYNIGDTIAEAAPAVRGAFAQQVPVVVVQAGVNDVYGGVDEATYRTEIAALLDEGSSSACVVWVNLQNFYARSYDALDGPAQRFNAVLAELASTRPWVSVADFASVSTAANLQAPDGLHPNAAGYRVWADAVMRTVLSCMPAPVNATAPDGSTPPVEAPTTTAPPTTAPPGPASSSEPASSAALTDPTYATYRCSSNVCGPNPPMGGDGTLPVGPLQIDPEYLESYRGPFNPNDVEDASRIVAEALADKRDELLQSSLGANFANWRSDPAIAAELWATLLEYAPVKLPAVATAAQAACAAGPTSGPQGALLAWPLTDPVASVEYGGSDGAMQVAGMLLAGTATPLEVLAAGAGTVVDVGSDTDGSFVLLSHGAGFTTRYGRLTAASVSIGATVATGATIGSAGERVYFQTLVEGSPRNPRLYVANAGDLAAATADPQAGAPVADPQTGTPVADPQAGTPVDQCTGLTRSIVVSSPAPGSSATPTIPTGLVIPVAGVSAEQLSDTWGAARSGGRRHQGIDIVRPIGTPVLAAYSGTVKSDFSNGQPCNKPNAPEPRSISILGTDNNNYYYGHMDQIFVTANQQVTAGEIIGTVGETGNACHSAPHLHFSINEGRDNVMNPYPLLVGARSLALSDFAGYLDAATLSNLASSAVASGAAGQVVTYAWFYGGLVKNDPNAGRLPGPAAATTGGATSATGAELVDEHPEVAAIIRQYFPPEQWDNAIRLANCESGLNPSSVSKQNSDEYASRDWGLFQLNDHWVLPPYLTRTGEDPGNFNRALDPHWNARVAAMIQSSSGWGQWTCGHPPTKRYPNLVGLVSMSPKMRENGGSACEKNCFDYAWHEPGAGDTSGAAGPPTR